MSNISDSQLFSLMHTGLSSIDEEEINETELLGDEDDIDIFDQDIFSDEDLHLSQFQEMEIEKSKIDYGQNSIGWQQFIFNTATSSKYVARVNDFLHSLWILM